MTTTLAEHLTPTMEQLTTLHYRANREADMFARLCVETTLVGDTDKALHWARRSLSSEALATELRQQRLDLSRIQTTAPLPAATPPAAVEGLAASHPDGGGR